MLFENFSDSLRPKIFLLTILCAFASMAVSTPATTQTAAEAQVATAEMPITPKPEIRWKFNRGKNIDYIYRESTKISVTGESNVEELNDISQEFSIEAEGTLKFAPNDDGTAGLTIAIKETPTGNEDENSADFMSNPELKEKNNMRVEVVYKPDGTFEIVDDDRKGLNSWVRSTLDKLYQMPDSPNPEPGYKWQSPLDYLAEDDSGEIDGDMTTTFVGWENLGDANAAHFEYKMSITLSGENENLKNKIKIVGEGSWYFDPAAGRVIKSNCTYTVTMRTEAHYEVEDENGGSKKIDFEVNAEGNGKVSLELEE